MIEYMRMDRKEQIMDAATLYELDEFNGGDPRDCFEKGAEWADAHPANPWISVKDRLPSNYKGVLVCFEVHQADNTINLDYCAAFHNSNNDWIAFGYNVQNAKINAKVTHWMPFPELPKEGGKR